MMHDRLATRAKLALLLTVTLGAAACSATAQAPTRGPTAAPGPAATPSAGRFAPTTFSVQVRGAGRPYIFIPGLASSGAVWDSVVAALPGVEAHVLTLAGFAGVPPVADRPFVGSVAEEVAEYIRANRLHEPVIVGHSLGGTLALLLAADEPGLVGPLVIVDALPFFPAAINPAATVEAMRPQAAMMRDQVARQSQEEFAAGQAAYFPSNITDPRHVAEVQALAALSDPATVGEAMYELLTMDLRPRLAEIRTPILVFGSWVMYGDREQIRRNFEAQYAANPGVRIELSEHGRHFLMYDDRETLLRLISEFVQ